MKKKILTWMTSLLFVLAPLFSSCGIFRPPSKDRNGYHIDHFDSCGPIAIEKAINEYYKRQGVVFAKNPAPRKEVSKQIQDDGILLKKFLSLFNKETVCVSWSWELKTVIKKYGFELIDVDDFEKLEPSRDIALVLVYGRFLSDQWHWACYPLDQDIKTIFGSNTKIDKILLLKKNI